MKFKKISFENYRCFAHATIDFQEKEKKNINLMIGPNGGGKTEMLFAFWWTLYGFDFKNLQNKESTPYALNCDLYRELEKAADGLSKKCSVAIEFENNETIFEIKKTAEYTKKKNKIEVTEHRTLSQYKTNGEKNLPIKDEAQVDRELSKVIPKEILNGILFDGERMKKLSSVDEQSKKAIQGTINDITNVALLERCKQTYKEVKKSINSSLSSIKTTNGFEEISQINKEIDKYSSLLEENLSNYNSWIAEAKTNEISLATIEKNLEGIKEIEAKTAEKKEKQADLKHYKTNLNTSYNDLRATLADGFLFVADKIISDLEEIIESHKVPEGLTVEAVESIISQDTCICGNPLTEKEIEVLNALKEILPPDNLNTTISEAIRKIKEKKDTLKKNAINDYNSIIENEKNIEKTLSDLSLLSTQILEGDAEGAKKLEKERIELSKRQGFLESSIPNCEKNMNKIKNKIKELRSLRDAVSQNDEKLKMLNKQVVYVEKCLKAFERIEQINKNKALCDINQLIDTSYKKLSEDAENGRRIHVVQYNEKFKYQMVVYIEKSVQEKINKWNKDGTYKYYVSQGLLDDEIKEQAIIESMDPNSTGQGKMNTLAFAKAILDYSSKEKDETGIEIRKKYPLLIDAPFSDIAGNNLINSAKELHNFSEQVILMIDSDKYGNIEKWIKPYVSNRYHFNKTQDKNISTVTKVEVN